MTSDEYLTLSYTLHAQAFEAEARHYETRENGASEHNAGMARHCRAQAAYYRVLGRQDTQELAA